MPGQGYRLDVEAVLMMGGQHVGIGFFWSLVARVVPADIFVTRPLNGFVSQLRKLCDLLFSSESWITCYFRHRYEEIGWSS